jgi:hypothetical protein
MLKLTFTKDMRRSWYFPVCVPIQLLSSLLAHQFQSQGLQRELGDVSDGCYRLAPSDWLSLYSIDPLVLHPSMPW